MNDDENTEKRENEIEDASESEHRHFREQTQLQLIEVSSIFT
jgi:hypothetical protein